MRRFTGFRPNWVPKRLRRSYSTVLDGIESFDLVLLGLGQDGHTASLFPGQEWGRVESQASVLAVHDAPKPPQDRVSLSAWRLSHAVKGLVSGDWTGQAGRSAVVAHA